MQAHLVAVQCQLEVEPYRSAAAFEAWVLKRCQQAVEGLGPGPRFVAFPEAVALPLVFWLEAPRAVVEASSTTAAAVAMLRGQWPQALKRGLLGPKLVYHLRAREVWATYQQAFEKAAKATQAYVFAGSLFSPPMDFEPAKGLHALGGKVHNLGLVVSPQGRVLSRVPKVHLTDHERKAFLDPGPLGYQLIRTRFGTIANFICLDAFYEGLIEWADASGAWLVVQPSANAAAWNGPWGTDPRQVEGEVWLREGLAQKLEGREHLRYGLNPMLNGNLYELRFEGRSGVYGAGRALALAAAPTGDAVVRLSVDIAPSFIGQLGA